MTPKQNEPSAQARDEARKLVARWHTNPGALNLAADIAAALTAAEERGRVAGLEQMEWIIRDCGCGCCTNCADRRARAKGERP